MTMRYVEKKDAWVATSPGRQEFLEGYFKRVLAFDPLDAGHKSITYRRHGPGYTLLPGRGTVLSRDEFDELKARCAAYQHPITGRGVELIEDRRGFWK